jgi:hypothetical protein
MSVHAQKSHNPYAAPPDAGHYSRMWIQLNAVSAYIGTYPFRGAVRTEPAGTVAVVQLKDASLCEGEIGPAVPRVANQDGKYDRYLLQPGDVLIQARATRRHLVGVVHLEEPAIAAPGLHALRPNLDQLTSAYLMWCLSHPKTQAVIASVAQGTHAPFLSKQGLMDLRIPVPPLSKQRAITEVVAIRDRQRQQLAQLAVAQDEFVNIETWNAATRDTEESQ